MGLRKRVKRLFERTEHLGFKEAFKVSHKSFKRIKNDFDKPDERLVLLKKLEQHISNIFNEHDFDIHKAVDKPDKARDGWRAYLTPWAAGGLAFAIINCTDGTSIPLMASLFPLYIAGGAVAVACIAAVIGVRALRRHRARELGLSVRDVKYARKLHFHHQKVQRHINKIEHYDESKKHLNSLINTFGGRASKLPKVLASGQPPIPGPAANQQTAVKAVPGSATL